MHFAGTWLFPLPVLGLLSSPALADDRLQPTVQLQGWATAYDQDDDPQADPAGYGDPEHDIGFSIPRARVGLDIDLGYLYVSSLLGTSAPYDALTPGDRDIGLVSFDATLQGRLGPGMARITGGYTRLPFSRELMMSSRDLVFQERAVAAEWLAPGRDTGILVDYEFDNGLRGRAGVYNGNLDLFGDNNDGVLVAGRLEFARGNTYRSFGRQGAIGFGLNGYYNADVATDTLGAGADTLIRFGPVSVMGEFLMAYIAPGNSTLDAPDVTDPTLRLGATGQASYALDIAGGTTEFAARLGWLDDATHLSDNGDVAIVHVGATLRDYLPGTDIGLGFIHREELGGRRLPNDTVRLWAQFRFPFEDRDLSPHTAPTSERTTYGTYEAIDAETGAPEDGAPVLTVTGKPLQASRTFTMPDGTEQNVSASQTTWDRNTQRLEMDFTFDGDPAVLEIDFDASEELLCGLIYEEGRRDEAASGEKRHGETFCWRRR